MNTGRLTDQDFIGLRSGQLTVVAYDRYEKPYHWVQAVCDCGTSRVVHGNNVRAKRVFSCGCVRRGVQFPKRQLPPGETSRRALWRRTKANAVQRNLPFELSVEDVASIVTRHCAYCNAPPRPFKQQGALFRAPIDHNGVDRIDSSLGYVLGNCVPCCTRCNVAKSDRSVEEFRSWVARIAAHQTSTGW